MRAAASGHEDCARALLQHEPAAQVTAADQAGDSPLILACRHGKVECVRLLLQHEPTSQVR
eukprot:365889-Chlamydomonas_euryale.AAC.10